LKKINSQKLVYLSILIFLSIFFFTNLLKPTPIYETYLTPIISLNLFKDIGFGPIRHSNATGFVVASYKEDNISYILANDHFCSKELEINLNPLIPTIITYNSGIDQISYSYKPTGMASVIYTDPEADLCLLETEQYLSAVVFDTSDLILPIPVTTVGAPEGAFPIVTDTYVSSVISRSDALFPIMENSGTDYLFLSGIILPGSSGSPLFNKKGNVVGIIFATTATTFGGLAIQSKDITKWLDNLGVDYHTN